MFYVERSNAKGGWDVMMASPHRLRIDDLRGPPGPHPTNQTSGADYMNDWPTPGNKTVFSGPPGSQARVRYNDTVVERYVWELIPVNEFDDNPERAMIWGWKQVEQNHPSVPVEELWPLQFVG